MTDLPKSVDEIYADRLWKHIDAVREFGRRMRVPDYQLAIHDQSKWSYEEFRPYALRFCSDLPKEETAVAFTKAWLHHIHHNPHHWQHWMFPDGFDIPGGNLENGVALMPLNYAREMIADWHGSGFAYTGSWDIQSWLWENMPKITVHSVTARWLREELDSLGYADTVYMRPFAHEEKHK